MQKFLTITFVTLGVIFLLLIGGVTLFLVVDPFNIKPLLFGTMGSVGSYTVPVTQPHSSAAAETSTASSNTPTTGSSASDSSFVLSAAQKQALQNLGVDPSKIPTSITSEQEACFVSVLGAARVSEIKAGAVPSAIEFFKAKACI